MNDIIFDKLKLSMNSFLILNELFIAFIVVLFILSVSLTILMFVKRLMFILGDI
ncbi:hypothetical protein GFV14_00299 [Candidatus Hartigia pinicola]|nr:hypothetical protein GFV14_00299 [Candidatus Hartigia pinicola]